MMAATAQSSPCSSPAVSAANTERSPSTGRPQPHALPRLPLPAAPRLLGWYFCQLPATPGREPQVFADKRLGSVQLNYANPRHSISCQM